MRDQFYQVFPNEVEIPILEVVGLFSETEMSVKDPAVPGNTATSAKNLMRQLLEAYLKLFSAITSPKQLYKYHLLYILYHELLPKSDCNLAKLALQCIVTYKTPSYLTIYHTGILQLYDFRAFRDSLLSFSQPETITHEHKEYIIPLLTRILYGRLISSSSSSSGGGKRKDKESNVAKRSAVFNLITLLDCAEQFVYFMIRGIVSKKYLMTLSSQNINANTMDKFIVDGHKSLYSAINNEVHEKMDLLAEDIALERLKGFLYMLEQMIPLVGMGLLSVIPALHMLVVAIVRHVTKLRNEIAICEDGMAAELEENDDDEEDQVTDGAGEKKKLLHATSIIRTLCIRRYTGKFPLSMKVS